jgi:pyruvate kinase
MPKHYLRLKHRTMYPVLTYSRNLGDFSHDLGALQQLGLKAIRLIYKGLSEELFHERIREIQQQIREQNLDIDILIDLPGKKPAVGTLQQNIAIQAGQEYVLAKPGSETSFPMIPLDNFFDHANFPNLATGDIISIADDELNMLVKEVSETFVRCEALNSFHLSSNRSLSVKNNPFVVTANSEKDLLFVQHLKDIPAYVKLLVSFTRDAGDILQLKALHPGADIIPKIETIIDDTTLLEILTCCQSVMLGRGDLSLACKPNELFAFQKKLIDLCKAQQKQLIIGTGLLTGIGDKGSPSIPEVMDFSYLRSQGIEGFLITGTNAQKSPVATLEFISGFEG